MTGGTKKGAGPVPMNGPAARILLVADSDVERAMPFIRECYGLRRFGVTLGILAPVALRGALGRFPAFAGRYWTHEPLPEDALDGVTALAAIPSVDILAKASLGLQDTASSRALVAALCREIPVYMDLDEIAQCERYAKNPYFDALRATYLAAAPEMGILPLPGKGYLASLVAALGLSLTEEANKAALPDSLGWVLAPETPGAGRSRLGDGTEPVPVVLTAAEVREYKGNAAEWTLPRDAVITPSARDAAEQRGLALKKAR